MAIQWKMLPEGSQGWDLVLGLKIKLTTHREATNEDSNSQGISGISYPRAYSSKKKTIVAGHCLKHWSCVFAADLKNIN